MIHDDPWWSMMIHDDPCPLCTFLKRPTKKLQDKKLELRTPQVGQNGTAMHSVLISSYDRMQWQDAEDMWTLWNISNVGKAIVDHPKFTMNGWYKPSKYRWFWFCFTNRYWNLQRLRSWLWMLWHHVTPARAAGVGLALKVAKSTPSEFPS